MNENYTPKRVSFGRTSTLISHLAKLSGGSVRRVAVNLAAIYEAASVEGWAGVDRTTWGDRPIYTGEAPRRAA